MSEAKQSSIITTNIMQNASEKYRQRRRKQMIRFYGATFATLICSRLVFKGVQSRRYIPNLFQANHNPPPFSKKQEAMAAIGYATLLAGSSFSMFVFGTAWVWDITTVKDFGQRMNAYLGGNENQQKISQLKTDQETLDVQKGLNSLIEEK